MELDFRLGPGDEEPVEETFLRNIRFAEWWQRERARGLRLPLRARIAALIKELPKEAADLITDDLENLVAETVRTRNAFTHADDSAQARAASGERLWAITTKLGVMLWLHVGLVDFGLDAVKEAVPGIGRNAHLCKYLSKSEQPDGGQPRLPGI